MDAFFLLRGKKRKTNFHGKELFRFNGKYPELQLAEKSLANRVFRETFLRLNCPLKFIHV